MQFVYHTVCISAVCVSYSLYTMSLELFYDIYMTCRFLVHSQCKGYHCWYIKFYYISKSTSQSDSISSNLLPLCIDAIVPINTRIVILTLSPGIFLEKFKSAFVKPLLKYQLLIQMM